MDRDMLDIADIKGRVNYFRSETNVVHVHVCALLYVCVHVCVCVHMCRLRFERCTNEKVGVRGLHGSDALLSSRRTCMCVCMCAKVWKGKLILPKQCVQREKRNNFSLANRFCEYLKWGNRF